MDATPTDVIPPNYRMPAEWEPHVSTWIAWPHQRADWPGKIAPIPWVYGEIVRHLHTHEMVHILVPDGSLRDRARRVLHKAMIELDRVHFHLHPTDRVWTRDYGPIFLVGPQGEKAYLDWRFNGWAKYDNCKHDDAIPSRLAKFLKMPSWRPRWNAQRIVLEGGSIDVNGSGLLLTTEECLLSPIQARNPQLSRTELEAVFAQYLGIQKVLWLGEGIVGDDTHGHVDDLARFVNAQTIVAVVEKNPSDANYHRLQDNWERLQGMTDTNGEKLEIVALPMPNPLVFAGQRLPASYANFYVANGVVLVPTFNDPNDRIALGILADLFPDRTVVGIHAVDLVWGLGTLHCMTQQEPLGNG